MAMNNMPEPSKPEPRPRIDNGCNGPCATKTPIEETNNHGYCEECFKRATDTDESLPDPRCDHEWNIIDGYSGTTFKAGRPVEMDVTYYECSKCGGRDAR